MTRAAAIAAALLAGACSTAPAASQLGRAGWSPLPTAVETAFDANRRLCQRRAEIQGVVPGAGGNLESQDGLVGRSIDEPAFERCMAGFGWLRAQPPPAS